MGKHLLASSGKALQKRRDLSWALKPECIFSNGESKGISGEEVAWRREGQYVCGALYGQMVGSRR